MTPFKAICIDSTDGHFPPGWGKKHLTEGKEYEVFESETSRGISKEEHYRIRSDANVLVWVRAVRFRKGSGTAKAASHSQPTDERQSEIEFFKTTQPGYCPCGIARAQCNYHR